MTATYPRIVFGDLVFQKDEILHCQVVEEFDPICAKLPAGSAEITLYSATADFSALNPYRDQEPLVSKQPLSIYETIDGIEYTVGLFFLDEWETADDTVIKFRCIDQIGLLDTYPFNGGLWSTPVTIDAILASITNASGVDFEIDPDVSGTTVKGWIPYGTCREALQQLMFATGLYAIAARQDGYINISRLITGNQIVTRGIVSGVAATGESRIRQKSWRPSQWSLSTIGEITEGMISADRPVVQKIGVTGVKVLAHNYTADTTTTVDIFEDTLTVGNHQIIFQEPHHSLNVTGGSVYASNANQVVVTVSVEGTVTVTGKPYNDSVVVFLEEVDPSDMGGRKENVITVEEAYLVNSTNGAEVAKRVFDYQQLRFIQKCRLYAPINLQVGSEVYVSTLYTQTLRGWIEKMSMDLSSGMRIDTEIVGDIEVPVYEIYSGLTATGESRIRQRSFRDTIGFQ